MGHYKIKMVWRYENMFDFFEHDGVIPPWEVPQEPTLKSRLFDFLHFRQHYGEFHKHNFHIVTTSPWPLFGSIGAFFLTVGLVAYMHQFIYGEYLVGWGLFTILATMYLWWRDIIRESSFLGYHTKRVQLGIRIGVILFIISEVMFFFAFFWAFFHASLAPAVILGSVWPPIGINTLNPLHIPLLNTFILLSSGVTVTLSHYSICVRNTRSAFYSLLITILLAAEFTALQGLEYYSALFYISDGVYGSTFYMATGFHGFHVLVGSTFLFVCLIRMMRGHFLSDHHIGFEAAIWYWHFVDVVWLFLYFSLYCWGNGVILPSIPSIDIIQKLY